MALFIIKLEDRILYDATAAALIAQSVGNQHAEMNTGLPDDAGALAIAQNDTLPGASDYEYGEGSFFIHVTDQNRAGFLNMVSNALAVQTSSQFQKINPEQVRNELPNAEITKHIGDNFGHGMSKESLSFRLVDGEPQLPHQSRDMNYSDAIDALNFVQEQPKLDSNE